MSTLRLTTIANQGGTSSVPSDTVISGSAKAWVNFNGTGTVAIRAAFNVSSITDNGVGIYTVNFSTSMVDSNYGVALGGVGYTATNASVIAVVQGSATVTVPEVKTTTQLRVMYTAAATAVAYDCAEMNVTIFR